jgi:hypothetical protein
LSLFTRGRGRRQRVERQVVWKQTPGATTAHDAKDGVEDLAESVYPGSFGSFGGREMGLPLGIG